MPKILVDPEQLDSISFQLKIKYDELNILIMNSRSLMNDLKASFKGQRANAIMSEWDDIQINLSKVVDSLGQASDIMKRASQDFRNADSAK